MRSPIRRPRRPHVTALTALASALLLASCSPGGDSGGAGTAAASPQEVFLQPVAAQGPDPFTPSTAKAPPATGPSTAPPAAPSPTRPPGAAATPPPAGPTATAQTVREITGSTPGLYGGTRSVASCDVEQQVAFLAGDKGKARAFAEAAGIPEANLAGWLRGLTPVVLRADTRVTSHGYRDADATAFQSVLQAGTAVLVDAYGTPRVRCACGNPLRAPAVAQGAKHTGRPWSGYRPDRVVVIRPTAAVVTGLVVVNVADNTWFERGTGTDGERDTQPSVIPPCEPAACDLTGSAAPVPPPPATETSPGPSTPASPDGSTSPGGPTPPEHSSPPRSEPALPPAPEPPAETEPEPDAELPPFEDLFPSDPGAQQPETFEG